MRVRELIAGWEECGDASIRLADRGRGGDVRVCDLTEDSRTVMPGSLFVARRGQKHDGRAYVAQAIRAGATAVLVDDETFVLPADSGGGRAAGVGVGGVALLRTRDIELATARLAERFYGDPSSKLTLIGVTGTNGKTTTTFLIHQILNAVGVRCGLIGTVCIDDGTEVARAELTTPPALDLSHSLARMVEAGCKAAVMEVSSHSLHQRRVGALRFKVGVFTNLTGDHLDYHRTMEEYGAAKAMLFEMLAEESAGGVAVLNIQDIAHTRMKERCRAGVLRCSVDGALPITGGTAPGTVCRARVRAATTGATEVTLTGPWGVQDVRLPLVGGFNVMNALQAAASAWAAVSRGSGQGGEEVSFPVIAEALAHATAPPGRLEPVTRDGDALSVFVDYAHSDDALRTVLTTLRESMTGAGAGGKGGKRALTCVFGCGGDRDKTKRARMGRVASELADQVYITSDNPRTEDPDAIIGEIVAGIEPARRAGVEIEPDREKAIRRAIRVATSGGVVLIAGKGHEDYQIVRDPARPGQTITRHFDDREVARSALAARGILPRASLPISVVGQDDAAVSLSAAIDATEALFDTDEGINPTPAPPSSIHQRTPRPSPPRSS